MLERVNPAVLVTVASLFLVMVLASLAMFLVGRLRPEAKLTDLRARINSWWVMIGVFAVAVALALGRVASIAYFGLASFIALKEYFSLVPTRRVDRRILLLCYLAIPVQFYWVGIAWYGLFIIFIPVYMFLLLPAAMVLSGQTEGFLKAAGTMHWGLMTCVFTISHAAFLLVLPPVTGVAAGGAGLLLTLVILTEGNDVAQYIAGRLFGRRKIVPSVSPNKTVAGFVGGVLVTATLGAAIAPALTPYGLLGGAAMGALLGVAGFIGDITISAVKRDIGVKDMGSLLPGHGGVLDRIDSLTFTAPLFFHFTYYFFY